MFSVIEGSCGGVRGRQCDEWHGPDQRAGRLV